MCLRVCYGQIFVLAIVLLSLFLFGELWHPNAHNSKKNQSQLLLAHFEGNLSVLCKILIINVLWSFCDNFISSLILINVFLCPKDTCSCVLIIRVITRAVSEMVTWKSRFMLNSLTFQFYFNNSKCQ